MIESNLIDNHILNFNENQRIDYLTLHEFIRSVSSEIQSEKKFNFPFYTAHGLLLYIGFDKKKKLFYIGFCRGSKLKDNSELLDHSTTNTIYKWFYASESKLAEDKEGLVDLIHQSIQYNKTKAEQKK